MSDAKSEQEPTMEEILASIRRIISDEEGAGGEAAAPSNQAPESEQPAAKDVAGADEDVLELTDVVNDDGTVTNLADEAPAIDDKVEGEGGLPDEVESEPAEPAEPVEEPEQDLPEPEKLVAPEATEIDLNGIISDTVAGEAASSLANLAGAVSGVRGVPLGSSDKTLEDIVKELLRPMLKDWLDENLPLLVERLVEREIHRISGRADED